VEGSSSEMPPLIELPVDKKSELPAAPTTVGKEMDIRKHILSTCLIILFVDLFCSTKHVYVW
jgi:hypothetical protein